MAVEVEDSTPVENTHQLAAWLEAGCKDASARTIGTEHEKFIYRSGEMAPVPYQPDGIALLLERLQRKIGWGRIVQDGNLIGLGHSHAAISLEPGGQFELSGAPLKNLHEMSDELDAHLAAVGEVASELGMHMLAIGLWPLGRLDDMPRMPKRRYDIMRAYMPKVGTLGLHMMHRTSTVQANLDFTSEREMGGMMRIAMALQPVVSALFASSPFSDGKPNGFKTFRMEIWRHTDADRSGILDFALDEGMTFERYVDWALDVPMYFVKRGEIYHDVAGVPFRALLEGKVPQLPDMRATMADWSNHLGTLFPEVRLKRFIEMRGADCGPPSHIKALPALWTGLLYDTEARMAASDLVKNWTAADVQALYAAVPKQGLEAAIGNRTLGDIARQVVALAMQGLKRRAIKNAQGQDEAVYLEVMQERAERGESLADEMLRKYAHEWRGGISRLFEEYVI